MGCCWINWSRDQVFERYYQVILCYVFLFKSSNSSRIVLFLVMFQQLVIYFFKTYVSLMFLCLPTYIYIFHIVFFFVLFLLYNSIHIFSLTCVFLLLLFPLSFLIFLVLLLGSNVRSGFELLLHKFYLIFIFYLDWILHVIRMYLMEA